MIGWENAIKPSEQGIVTIDEILKAEFITESALFSLPDAINEVIEVVRNIK